MHNQEQVFLSGKQIDLSDKYNFQVGLCESLRGELQRNASKLEEIKKLQALDPEVIKKIEKIEKFTKIIKLNNSDEVGLQELDDIAELQKKLENFEELTAEENSEIEFAERFIDSLIINKEPELISKIEQLKRVVKIVEFNNELYGEFPEQLQNMKDLLSKLEDAQKIDDLEPDVRNSLVDVAEMENDMLSYISPASFEKIKQIQLVEKCINIFKLQNLSEDSEKSDELLNLEALLQQLEKVEKVDDLSEEDRSLLKDIAKFDDEYIRIANAPTIQSEWQKQKMELLSERARIAAQLTTADDKCEILRKEIEELGQLKALIVECSKDENVYSATLQMLKWMESDIAQIFPKDYFDAAYTQIKDKTKSKINPTIQELLGNSEVFRKYSFEIKEYLKSIEQTKTFLEKQKLLEKAIKGIENIEQSKAYKYIDIVPGAETILDIEISKAGADEKSKAQPIEMYAAYSNEGNIKKLKIDVLLDLIVENGIGNFQSKKEYVKNLSAIKNLLSELKIGKEELTKLVTKKADVIENKLKVRKFEGKFLKRKINEILESLQKFFGQETTIRKAIQKAPSSLFQQIKTVDKQNKEPKKPKNKS